MKTAVAGWDGILMGASRKSRRAGYAVRLRLFRKPRQLHDTELSDPRRIIRARAIGAGESGSRSQRLETEGQENEPPYDHAPEI